jgi:hypothetical protein
MLRKIALVIVAIFVSAVVIVVIHDYWWRCSDDGLDKAYAVSLANEFLRDIKKGNETRQFTLQSSKLQEGVWLFVYVDGDCRVDLFVDKCGVVDAGGLTVGCR